jgi:DNA topoisomerase-3
MKEIRELTEAIVNCMRNFNEIDTKHSRKTSIISPIDGQPLFETIRGYTSSDKSLTIPRVIGGREFSEDEVAILLRNGRIGPFDNFKSRIGNPFKASIILESGRAKLEFENKSPEAHEEMCNAVTESMANGTPLCDCPTGCGGKMYSTSKGYACSGVINPQQCNMKVCRFILGHELLTDEAIALFTHGKTELINDFTSNRSGKSFSAFLKIDKNGKLSFKFPTGEKKENANAESKQTAKTKKRPDRAPKRRGRISKYA